jgi:phenylalanyl-tRNA synthetase beta chain
LALALTGPTPRHWSSGERLSDFYDIKGAIEQLVDNFGRCSQTMQLTFAAPGDEAALHPGRSARVLWQGEPIGAVGEAHPDIADAWELRGRVYLAWLDLESIASIHQKLKYEFHTIPKFPASWRDLALVVDRKTAAAEVLETVRAAGGALLEDLELFDVYEGEHVANDKKSIALRLRLRSLEDTLKEEDIQSVVDRVLKKLQKQLGAELRS